MKNNLQNNAIKNKLKYLVFLKKISMKVLLLSFIISKCVDIRLFYVDTIDEVDQGTENTVIINSLSANATIFVKNENICYSNPEFITYINLNYRFQTINNFIVQYNEKCKFTVRLFERNLKIKNIFIGKISKGLLDLFDLLLREGGFWLYENLNESTFLDFLRFSNFFEIDDDEKFSIFLKEMIIYYNGKIKNVYFQHLAVNLQKIHQEVDNWVILKSFNILLQYLYKDFFIYSNSLSEIFEAEILDKDTLFITNKNNVEIVLSPTFANTWKNLHSSFSEQPLLNFLLQLINVNIIEITGFQDNNIFEFGLFMTLIPHKADILYIHDTETDIILDLLRIFLFSETVRILKVRDKTLTIASSSKFCELKNLRNIIIEVESLSSSVLESILEVVKSMSIESLSIKCEKFLIKSNNLILKIPIEIPSYNFSICKYIKIEDEASKCLGQSYGNVITSISVEISDPVKDDLLNFLSVFLNLNELCICNNGSIEGSERLPIKLLEKYNFKSLKLQNFELGSLFFDKILNASFINYLCLIKCQIEVVPDSFQNPYFSNISLTILDIFDSSFIPVLFYKNFVFNIKNLQRYNYSGKYMEFEVNKRNSEFGSDVLKSDTSLYFSNSKNLHSSNNDADNLEFNIIASYFIYCSFTRLILKDIELDFNQISIFKSMTNITSLTLNNVRYTESKYFLGDIFSNSTFSSNLKSLHLVNMDLNLNDVKFLNLLSSMVDLDLTNINKNDDMSYFSALKRISLRKLKVINIIGDISRNNINYLEEEFTKEMLRFGKN